MMPPMTIRPMAMARPIEVIDLENDVPNIVYIRFDSYTYG